VTPITVRALCRDLGRVCDRIAERGGPDLACLVVRASDGLPGAGYFQAMREAGRYTGPDTGPEAVSFIENEQARAQEFVRRKECGEDDLPRAPTVLWGGARGVAPALSPAPP
jgi:hypothetical protein